MHSRRLGGAAAGAALLLSGTLGASVLGAADASADALQERAKQIFGVLPESAPSEANPITPEKVDLGRMLYYDTRFSISQTIACNSCHMLDKYGVDHEPTSPGHEGKRGERNSPTVYNAALQLAQFWDGRAADVEEQAKGPVLNPVEMGMPAEDVVLEVLNSIPGYRDAFAKAFPESSPAISFDNMARAIGAFERKLMTPGRFDRYLQGDASALTDAEKKGLQTFMDTGCITCHNQATVGGQMFQKLGLIEPYPTEDKGRAKVTGRPQDEYVFKVPMLRNVAETGPWFHDGSIDELDMAVRVMARHQLGKTLTDEETASIVTFLKALTGEIPRDFIAKPELPASGPDTPGPGEASAPPSGAAHSGAGGSPGSG